MEFIKDYWWFIIIIFAYIFLKNPKSSKPKRNFSYTNNPSIRITEMNKSIMSYNSILSRFDIIATRANRICYNKQDLKSLKQLEFLTNEFMELYPKCSDLINEIKKIDDNDNRFEYLIFEIKQLIADMDILLNKIETVEYNSQDYSSINKTFKFENDNKRSETINTSIYFGGCNNLDSLNKRYHILAKAYHPDNNFGDKYSFQKMSDEYNLLKKKYV